MRRAKRAIPDVALAFVVGAWLAGRVGYWPLPALAGLVASGLASQRRLGQIIAAGAVGVTLALASGVPGGSAPGLDATRPVEVLVRVVSHPVVERDEIRLRARCERARQGLRVAACRFDVWVTLPAALEPPQRGTRLRVRGWLRRSRPPANGPRATSPPWRIRVASLRLVALEAPAPAGSRLVGRFRGAMRRHLNAAEARHAGAALIEALALGDAGALPERWRSGLRRAGLAHVTAVSGLHIGMVTMVAWVLGGWLPRGARIALSALATLGYLALVGPRPSALRAAAMALALLAALAVRRPPSPFDHLTMVVVVAVVWRVESLADLGFGLSVAATASLLVLAPRLSARWTWLPSWFRGPLTAAAAAQWGTLLLAVPTFALVHPLTPLLDLIAVPWLAVVLVVAGGWLVVTVLAGPAAAEVLLLAADLLTLPLASLANIPTGPWLGVPISPHRGVALAIAVVALGALWFPRSVGTVLVIGSLIGRGPIPRPPIQEAEVRVLDVGQGDAILLRHGARTVLVDGGGWRRGDLGARVLLPALAWAGVTRLDVAVSSHADEDHCRGLAQVADYLPVGEVWTSLPKPQDPCSRALLDRAGGRWRGLRPGTLIEIGAWKIEAMHPDADFAGADNDRSLVLMAEAFGRRLLLTGDIGTEVERRLVASRPDSSADVLKVAHHGSRSSTSAAWLAQVRPRWALVSAGHANPYGHPTSEVLSRLRRSGARVLRTDRGGAIVLRFRQHGPILVERPGFDSTGPVAWFDAKGDGAARR